MDTDTDTRGDTTETEMRQLAEMVAGSLETEAGFEVGDWYGECENCACDDFIPGDLAEGCENCEHEPIDHLGALPGSIRELVDLDEFAEDPERAIEEAYETWQERATEDVLDIRGEVSFTDSGVELEGLTVVLGTGGPHVEVTFNYSGNGYVRAYTWGMQGDNTRHVALGGHPLAELFDHFAYMLEEMG